MMDAADGLAAAAAKGDISEIGAVEELLNVIMLMVARNLSDLKV